MNDEKKSIIEEKAKVYFEIYMSRESLSQDSVIEDMTIFTKNILEEFGINTENL